MKAIFLNNNPNDTIRVYAKESIDILQSIAGLDPTIYTASQLCENPTRFSEVEYIFSTWGMPTLTETEIKTLLPSLKCVFYAAGSVQYFAKPFINCGVKVFSAWAANAVPVAEYTVSQIILANKGFFKTSRLMSEGNVTVAGDVKGQYRGNYGENIGIIGAGMIGKLVIKMLQSYRLSVLVFDPFLPEDKAIKLGVKKCELIELFEKCSVVSNHLANNKHTQKLLNYSCFCRMLPYATFLNTGRGAQVVEDDLTMVLSERSDLTAILDVTDPEPPKPHSPFYALDNCILTPHIAGSSGDEVHRMAEYMTEEYRRYSAGESCFYEVTEKLLETMA